jgi:DNA-binding NarL/FixJ family response regulator
LPTTLRILIVDDHEVVRTGLRKLLETQPGWSVVGEATNGLEAVESATRLKPDVIIMDFGMPVLNGLQALQRIVKTLPRTRTLILTMHDSDELLGAVARAGACGYLKKSAAAEQVISAVQAIGNNMTFFGSGSDQRTTSATMEAASDLSLPKLTSRQREIIQLVAGGKSTKEVAEALGLSVKTVETHRANIMARLNIHSVGELIRYAIRNGLAHVD